MIIKKINLEITVLIILYKEDFIMVNTCLKNLNNFKIIIIDNDNNINLKNKLCAENNIYQYILNKKNVGFATAANQGINKCLTKYMFILTADCLITEKNILNLLVAKNKYQDTIITSPTLYDNSGNLTYNGGPLPENGAKDKPLKIEGDTCVEAVITTAVLFDVNEIKKIGLIDKNFFLYFLDDDLGRRIKLKKKSIIQVFNSKAIHEHGNLKISNSYKKIFVRNFNFTYDELYYYYKNNTHSYKLKILKKKSYKYVFKIFLNLLIFRISKSVYYFSKVLALLKFMINHKNNI